MRFSYECRFRGADLLELLLMLNIVCCGYVAKVVKVVDEAVGMTSDELVKARRGRPVSLQDGKLISFENSEKLGLHLKNIIPVR